MLSDIAFTLVIFPLRELFEVIFNVLLRFLGNPGFAVLGLSAAVSALSLPVYFRAERYRRIEQSVQDALAPGVRKIKAVFSGDERFMLLQTYYRQRRYHPVFALRSSLAVLFQVPFFLAAYSFLSHLRLLDGAAFFFLRDLSRPDGLLRAGSVSLNILPLVMTLCNVASAIVYTRGRPLKEKAHLYLIAALFLVLLYRSPSALVLYWTANNVFSLAKNILARVKHARKLLFALALALALAADVYLLRASHRSIAKRLMLGIALNGCLFTPLLAKPLRRLTDIRVPCAVFAFSCLSLWALLGCLIPATLIASSVEEFTHLGGQASPFPFIARTALQAAGIFLFWLPCLYALFSERFKRAASLASFAALVYAAAHYFAFDEHFGFLTNALIFSEPRAFSLAEGRVLASLALLALIPAAVISFARSPRGGRGCAAAAAVIFTAVCGASAFRFASIASEEKRLEALTAAQGGGVTDDAEAVYVFSRTSGNVLLIMLDCAVGSFLPYTFEERPDLKEAFKDFTWYPNTVSFANHTLAGAPPVYGGYEYTPRAIQERADTTLFEKRREAYTLLPVLFAAAGYRAVITDPPFDNDTMLNTSIFPRDENIRALNITGKYTGRWLRSHGEIRAKNIRELLLKRLIRFSLFKTAPLFLRVYIYDDGDWFCLDAGADSGVTSTVLADYAFMDMLPALTKTDDGSGTYTMFYGHLSHNSACLQYPDYLPSDAVTDRGRSVLKNSGFFHTLIASLLCLDRWFAFLRAEGVYDNTRIIIAADHGRGNDTFPENFRLPAGGALQSYNPLLMVKDFGANGADAPRAERAFMTNADAALFAASALSHSPRNPFTGKPLQSDKADGVYAVTFGALNAASHSKYAYRASPSQWLFVHDNIFDPAAWSARAPERHGIQ